MVVFISMLITPKKSQPARAVHRTGFDWEPHCPSAEFRKSEKRLGSTVSGCVLQERRGVRLKANKRFLPKVRHFRRTARYDCTRQRQANQEVCSSGISSGTRGVGRLRQGLLHH